MSLKQNVDNQIKEAMKAKDQDALRALRGIKSMILLAETSEGQSGELSNETEMKLLTKAAKQRKESADTYTANGRNDLAETELKELKIIESFLPKQLSEDEVNAILKNIIAQTGAVGAKDMGKVMGAATKELAGKADGKMISELVKKLLA
ncbi:MAG: GatB/YqeY domain-containing protein [Bacteroidota bacterium]|nr:GatB/YqeY domain-containing protein [Bacteroidota bacterium]